MYLEKKSAPGRLSRPRDPSRSTRAVILRPGMSWGSRIADLEVDSCKIEGPRVPGRASTFFCLFGGFWVIFLASSPGFFVTFWWLFTGFCVNFDFLQAFDLLLGDFLASSPFFFVTFGGF